MSLKPLNESPITIFDNTMIHIRDVIPMREYPEGCTLAMVKLDQDDNPGQEIPMLFWTDMKPWCERGAVWCPSDWQSIPGIYSTDDVPETTWIDVIDGTPAIMLDGLPRVLVV